MKLEKGYKVIKGIEKDYIINDNDDYEIRLRKNKNDWTFYAIEFNEEDNKYYITWLAKVKTFDDIANELLYFDIDIINVESYIDTIVRENVVNMLKS